MNINIKIFVPIVSESYFPFFEFIRLRRLVKIKGHSLHEKLYIIRISAISQEKLSPLNLN